MFRPALAALCAFLIGFAATPADAQDNTDRQSGVLLDAFMTVCAMNPGQTQEAATAAEKSGFQSTGALEKQIGEPLRMFTKSSSKGPIKLVLSETPWRCMISAPGPTLRGFGEALGIMGHLLQSEPGNTEFTIERQSKQPRMEIHTVVSLDTEDGGHEIYTARAGGTSFEGKGMFMLEHSAPLAAPEFTRAFKDNFLSEIDATEPRTRNSLIALNLVQKLCLEMHGDYDGVNAWAEKHLVPDTRQAINTADTRGWKIADKDVDFTLIFERGSRRFCKMTGGPVNANAAHDGLRAMLDGWTGPGGYSISPNAYTERTYQLRPNDMPSSKSYYSGGIFHTPAVPKGIDTVLSTRRTGDTMSLVFGVKSLHVEDDE